MLHLKAPEFFGHLDTNYKVFLAGSIEMGKADKWQDKVANSLESYGDELALLNPRRDDWDSSWKQEKTNPVFRQQVLWELEALENCDMIAMYFDPKTKSPITLLELGQFANKIELVCPDNFWRKGNVELFAERYGIKTHNSLEELVTAIHKNFLIKTK